jgi:hypothetical protein
MNRTEMQESWKQTAIKTATKIGPFQPVLWALKSAYILFLAGDGWRVDQRDSRSGGSQVDHHVRPLQPPFPCT